MDSNNMDNNRNDNNGYDTNKEGYYNNCNEYRSNNDSNSNYQQPYQEPYQQQYQQQPYQEPYQQQYQQQFYQDPYQQPYPQQPYYQQPPYSQQMELEEPVKMSEWMITWLIMMIPCVNIIMMFVWAFSKTEKKSKSNFFKAYLIFMGILLVLYLLIFMLFMAAGVGVLF